MTANGIYGPYSAPLTSTSSTASNGSGMYIDQNAQYTQYLTPQYQSSNSTNPQGDNLSQNGQNGSASPGKLDVRLSGHARAVSLPASVVMQSSNSQQSNGHYDAEQRMYGLGLEASE